MIWRKQATILNAPLATSLAATILNEALNQRGSIKMTKTASPILSIACISNINEYMVTFLFVYLSPLAYYTDLVRSAIVKYSIIHLTQSCYMCNCLLKWYKHSFVIKAKPMSDTNLYCNTCGISSQIKNKFDVQWASSHCPWWSFQSATQSSPVAGSGCPGAKSVWETTSCVEIYSHRLSSMMSDTPIHIVLPEKSNIKLNRNPDR